MKETICSQILSRPLLPGFFSLAGGIWTGGVLTLPDLPLQIALAATLAALLLAARTKILFFFLSFGVIFLTGILLFHACLGPPGDTYNIVNPISKAKMTGEGTIVELEHLRDDALSIVVELRKAGEEDSLRRARGRIKLTIGKANRLSEPVRYGDYVRFHCVLRDIRNYQNPGGFNHARHLRYQGIVALGQLRDRASLVVIRKGQGNPLRAQLEDLRGRAHTFIIQNTEGVAGRIISALTVGERKALPAEIRDAFARTGTAHLLAISGLHVGIIAGFSFFLVRFILKSSTYLMLRFNIMKIATVASVLPVSLYIFLAGGSPSVIRAGIMVIVFLIAAGLDRLRDITSALALAGFVILLFDPLSLFNISFQLSFTAVATLLFAAPLFSPKIPSPGSRRGIKRSLSLLLGFVLVNLAATLGTAPLIAHYFYLFSVISPLANLFAVPLLGFIALPCSLAALLLSPLWSWAARSLLALGSQFTDLAVSTILLFNSLPCSSLLVSPPSPGQVFLYYALLILGIGYLRLAPGAAASREGRVVLSGFILLISLALIQFWLTNRSGPGQNDLSLTAIDVGRGSSSLIEFPQGKRLLIDGGGSPQGDFDVGKNVLAPYFLSKKIKSFDLVVLTHPHSDHLDGLLYILERFPIGEIWTNGQAADTENYQKLIRLIGEKKILHRIISAGTPPRIIDSVTIECFNPGDPAPLALPAAYDEINNNSLVLKLTFREVGILLPGDIQAEAEAGLIKRGHDLKSRILLVPHHGGGSSNSRDFIKAVSPVVAIISTGRGNPPPRQTVERYQSIGARILRTDLSGAITVRTDGETVTVETFSGAVSR